MTSIRSAEQRDALIDALARRRFDGLEAILPEITNTARDLLSVDRVSIWLFSDDRRLLHRIEVCPECDHYPRSRPLTLDVTLRPDYTEQLLRDSVYRLSDRREMSPRAGDDLSRYLEQRGILSLLDSAIVIDDRVSGVLCHEHGTTRLWSPECRDIALRLADITADAIVFERRRRSAALGYQFRLLVEASADSIGMANAQGVIEYLNPTARRVLGLTGDEPVHGMKIEEFLAPNDRERMRASIIPAARETGSWTGRIRMLTRQARVFEATTTINVYRGRDGAVEYVGCVIRDLSFQIDAERRIAEVRANYEAALVKSGDTLFQIDTRTLQISNADEHFRDLLGYEAERYEHLTLLDISAETADEVRARVDQTLAEGHLLCGERRLRDVYGETVEVEMSMVRIGGYAGPAISVRLRDIRELAQRRRYVEQLAYFDPLTGLANSNFLRERAETMLAERLAMGGRVGFILLQIERWQRIFDIQGYQVAETLIRQAGFRIKDAFAGHDVTLARVLGGVEFGVLFDADAEADDELVRIAHTTFRDLFRAEEENIQLSICSGSAEAPQHAVNFKDLTKRAGIALRTAHARNMDHCYYDPAQSSRIRDERLIEEDLREAIGTSQLTLRYQPILADSTSECIWGMETLVRWQHPQFGFLPPSDFIPLAEETQLIVTLDRHILAAAARTAAAWTGPLAHAVLTVNVSGVTLMTADICRLLDDVLADSGLDPTRLCLEVTETSIMTDLAQAARSLARAHNLGVMIALDDFGTGYSSLAYLKDLPVDILKIDRDFVRGIGMDRRDERAIQTVVQMGHDLGIRVLAEGVETAPQRAWLWSQQVDLIQGFHIARPMTAEVACEGGLHTRFRC
ncbi:EAL domain-containing protein [Salinisphaera sp. T31B1]|uniref:bifunctional diguanylate cyclase/phosphodiesterase n=1 Tax=Salinisphaera sp. T31B1 TaxID=727963 RepID=UPI00333E714D